MNFEVTENSLFPKSGYKWDQFEETGQLGEGGFGRVMSAIYMKSKVLSFAIKHFTLYKKSDKDSDPSLNEDPTVEDVKNEIDCLESLYKLSNLPNTLPSYYGHICLTHKIKTEFQLYFNDSGYPIIKYFKINDHEWKIVKHVIDQLIMTFAFLQSNGLAHQDLKPGNILIQETQELPKITVIDFGIATIIQESLTTRPILRNMGGTDNFLSPERRENVQENEQKLNPFKSDTFSLGLVLLYLIIKRVFKLNVKLTENKLNDSLEILLDHTLDRNKDDPSKEQEIRWYHGNILKKMLIYEASERPDFIELYYCLCNKNRKSTINHLLDDFQISKSVLKSKIINNEEEEERKNDQKSDFVSEDKFLGNFCIFCNIKLEIDVLILLNCEYHSSCKTCLTLNNKCNICNFCEKCKTFHFICLPCNHSFCYTCLQSQWEELIEAKEATESSMKCPECSQSLELNFLRSHFSTKLFQKFEDFLSMSSIVRLDNEFEKSVYCPNKNCKQLLIVEKKFSYITCYYCSFKFCIKCQLLWENHQACNKLSENVNEIELPSKNKEINKSEKNDNSRCEADSEKNETKKPLRLKNKIDSSSSDSEKNDTKKPVKLKNKINKSEKNDNSRCEADSEENDSKNSVKPNQNNNCKII